LAKFDALTDEEVEAAARSDPDNPPMTEEQLKGFRRVVDARRVRRKLKMTQEEFAETFEIPLGTLRDWEQKWTFISQNRAAANYLRVIEQNPEAVIEALRAYRPERIRGRGRIAGFVGVIEVFRRTLRALARYVPEAIKRFHRPKGGP